MSLLPAAAILCVCLLSCAPMVALSRRILKNGNRARHHEIGTAVFLQLGAIYAVLLAFIFNEVYAEYVVAAQAVNRECAALHGAAMLSASLPDPGARLRVQSAMAGYVGDVIDREWKAMADGHFDERTEIAQRRLLDAAATPAGDPSAQSLRTGIVDQLLLAHESRETRIFEMSLVVPGLVWLLLLCLTGVLVALLLLADIESFWPQAALTGAFVGAITFFLLVIRLLDNPFEGPLGIAPSDFVVTLARIRDLTGA